MAFDEEMRGADRQPDLATVARFVDVTLRVAADAKAPPSVLDALLDALRAINDAEAR